MKFKIKTETLEKSLAVVEHALPSKTVIETLKGIKIEARNGKITLSASKQDIAIMYNVTENFSIESEGVAIVPGSYLIKIIKKTYDAEVTISSNDNTTLIASNSSKVELVEYDISSYPDIRFDNINGTEFKINKAVLAASFNQTKQSVSTDTSTPVITGINYNFSSNGLLVSSTDARRLALSSFKNDEGLTLDFTIFKNNLSDVIKVCETVKEVEIPMLVNKNQLAVISENLKVKTRLLEGEYPDIQRLIPTNINYSFVVDAINLKHTLDKIMLLSDHDTANVKARIEGDELILESQFRELGAIEEKCQIERLSGSPFVICFDPRFLNEAINSINAEKIEMKLVDEVSAFMVNGYEKSDNIHIISPYRTT